MTWQSAGHFLVHLFKNRILTPLDICLCAFTTQSYLRHSLHFVCHIIPDKVSQRTCPFIIKTDRQNEVKKARNFWSGIQDFMRKKSYISLSVSYRKSSGCSLNECQNEELGILEGQNLIIYENLPQPSWGLAPRELQQIFLDSIICNLSPHLLSLNFALQILRQIITRFLFCKQHFYKQHLAEICQFSKPISENMENWTLNPLPKDCSLPKQRFKHLFVRQGKAGFWELWIGLLIKKRV